MAEVGQHTQPKIYVYLASKRHNGISLTVTANDFVTKVSVYLSEKEVEDLINAIREIQSIPFDERD